MAVGFSISMRVERLVARASLDHIRSRQLGEAALARVVYDVNDNLNDQMIPNWSGDWVGGVFESIAPGPNGMKATNLLSGLNMLYGYASNYVPRSMISSTLLAADNAEWIPFEYISPTGGRKRIGQYAYVVVDCSGMIDVNFDYSISNNISRSRRFGETVYELQMTNPLLREVALRATNMMWGRVRANGQSVEKPWFRLETVAEINPVLSRGFHNAAPLLTATDSVNLVTYSRIPRGYLKAGAVEQPLVITDPLDQTTLSSAFTDLGLPDAGGFFNNLRDYTDSDNVPSPNPDGYSTEAVPMINEVVVSNSYKDVSSGGTNLYRNEYRVFVELWWPFSNTTNLNNLSLLIRAAYSKADPAPNPGSIVETISLSPPGGSWSMGDFLVVTSSPRFVVVTNILQDLSEATVQVELRVQENGVDVDRMGVTADKRMEIPIGNRMTGLGVSDSLSKSANDPRINWDGKDGAQWITQNTHSLGKTNSGLTFTSANADGHFAMYVANRPLKAVGELGLLLYAANKPWQTVSLLDGPNFFPVLDRFTLFTNQVRYGLVNPNSYNSNVIATVFNQMPLERVPYDPATNYVSLGITNKLTITDLKALGRRFANKDIAFTNLSDLSHIGPQLTAAVPGLDVVTFESVVRNSAGLFAPRQQLFAVFLVAQLQDEAENVLAEQRGTGLIWRDPYIVSNNTHATMVRNFRWLTE